MHYSEVISQGFYSMVAFISKSNQQTPKQMKVQCIAHVHARGLNPA